MKPLDARTVMLRAMSEASLQSAIIEVAHQEHWLVHHDPAAQDPKGRWRTHVHGDVGFPDLVMARDGEVIIVELKAEHGRFEPGQREWLQALGGKVVRPRDMDNLIARLRHPRLTSPPDRA